VTGTTANPRQREAVSGLVLSNLTLARHPQSGRLAFLHVHASATEPVLPDMTSGIPVDIDVFEARLSLPTLLAYIIFLAGAIIPIIGGSIVTLSGTSIAVILGSAILISRPRILVRGSAVETLQYTLVDPPARTAD